MVRCEYCKHSGANMRLCKKCGKTYCTSCSYKGVGTYTKGTAMNRCPFCKSYNCGVTAK